MYEFHCTRILKYVKFSNAGVNNMQVCAPHAYINNDNKEKDKWE